MQQEALEIHVQEPFILGFWEKLKTVKRIYLRAKSHAKNETGWNGIGKGDVVVTKDNETTWIFHERGAWQMAQSQEVAFSNTFRWTLDRRAGTISLEHLRLGPHVPVFLFDLAPLGARLLGSVHPHLCGEDAYLVQVMWDQYGIYLSWRVIGPQKNEEMEYHYF